MDGVRPIELPGKLEPGGCADGFDADQTGLLLFGMGIVETGDEMHRDLILRRNARGARGSHRMVLALDVDNDHRTGIVQQVWNDYRVALAGAARREQQHESFRVVPEEPAPRLADNDAGPSAPLRNISQALENLADPCVVERPPFAAARASSSSRTTTATRLRRSSNASHAPLKQSNAASFKVTSEALGKMSDLSIILLPPKARVPRSDARPSFNGLEMDPPSRKFLLSDESPRSTGWVRRWCGRFPGRPT